MSHCNLCVRVVNASLVWHGKHSSVIQEIFELHHRLQNSPQILRTGETKVPNSPHGEDIESDAPFSELEPRHFTTIETLYELLVHLTKCYLRGPCSIHSNLHGLCFKHKDDNLGFLGSKAECQGVPCLVCQDGEVGGQECGGGRERGLLGGGGGGGGGWWWKTEHFEKL